MLAFLLSVSYACVVWPVAGTTAMWKSMVAYLAEQPVKPASKKLPSGETALK